MMPSATGFLFSLGLFAEALEGGDCSNYLLVMYCKVWESYLRPSLRCPTTELSAT
jgi:hypothetical protein